MTIKELLEASETSWSIGIQTIAKYFYEATEDKEVAKRLECLVSSTSKLDDLIRATSLLDNVRAEYYNDPSMERAKDLQFWYHYHRMELREFLEEMKRRKDVK